MSARVFNPLVMSEMRRMMGRSSSDSNTPTTVARVRRELFGPVNHEEAQSFVEKELVAIRNRESEKWGFDFVRELPLDNSRFKWERISPEANIPEAYALRRLSSLRQTAAAATTTTGQGTTTQKTKSCDKQSQITDFLKCRKRSLSVGDISSRKVGSAAGDLPASKVGTTGPEPSKSKRTKTRQ